MDESIEAATFWLALLGTLLGMAILLYGVSLNSGVALNTTIVAGGVIMLIALALHTAGIMLVPETETETETH